MDFASQDIVPVELAVMKAPYSSCSLARPLYLIFLARPISEIVKTGEAAATVILGTSEPGFLKRWILSISYPESPGLVDLQDLGQNLSRLDSHRRSLQDARLLFIVAVNLETEIDRV